MRNEALLPYAEKWLTYAKSDLVMSKHQEEFVLFNNLCFHAQQCVEKSVKAVLILHSIEYPRTHDINKLVGLFPPDIQWEDELRGAGILSEYAIEARYPGDRDEVSEEDYKIAIALAESVFGWASKIVSEK